MKLMRPKGKLSGSCFSSRERTEPKGSEITAERTPLEINIPIRESPSRDEGSHWSRLLAGLQAISKSISLHKRDHIIVIDFVNNVFLLIIYLWYFVLSCHKFYLF